MKKFEEKKFNLPKLKGFSEKSIEEHLKLYTGYVKHTNLVLDHIEELSVNSEKFAYELGELQRRFAFEFDGMRNHEYYFESLQNGSVPLIPNGLLYKEMESTWGSFDKWLARFKSIAAVRGVGWAMLYYDKESKKLLNQWVDEHHLGQLASCSIVLALDVWEHAFVSDYQPSGKKQYIDDFFENLNWRVIEENFKKA